MKLKELMKDLTKNYVLGRVTGQIYVVEFQKRGLPHAHILLILAEEDKPKCVDDYDHIVSAEIPNPDEHPNAYETVLGTMIHGPCGAMGIKNACMKDGKCTKHYPRDFVLEIIEDEDGYPRYQHRDNR